MLLPFFILVRGWRRVDRSPLQLRVLLVQWTLGHWAAVGQGLPDGHLRNTYSWVLLSGTTGQHPVFAFKSFTVTHGIRAGSEATTLLQRNVVKLLAPLKVPRQWGLISNRESSKQYVGPRKTWVISGTGQCSLGQTPQVLHQEDNAV